jgi:putative lipoic acid-binding regulatory protein
MTDKEAFYIKLKGRLENTTKFPAEYLYKFIVPAEGEKVQEVAYLFKEKFARITTKESKTGKYISISIKLKLASSDEVIFYYKQAEKIEGIISL